MEAILDKRIAKKGVSRVPTAETEAMLRLRREEYRDYNIRHFYEKPKVRQMDGRTRRKTQLQLGSTNSSGQ